MKYRKKPVVIEAFKFGIDNMPEWFFDRVVTKEIILRGESEQWRCPLKCCEIQTLEGVMVGNRGDYIIQGIKGEIYPCKADIFEATYDLVEGQCPPHEWDKSGERCLKCGGKDWMT